MDLVHDPFIARDRSRADRDWDWRMEVPLLTFGLGLARKPRMFQLRTADTHFPLAMVSLLEHERWIGNRRRPAVFLWFMAGAPAVAVADHGAPRLITAAALDIALTISLNGAAQGRLWLHADPRGGGKLMDWYANRGLERVPADTTLPGPRVSERVNDGRYFWTAGNRSTLVSGRMEAYRT